MTPCRPTTRPCWPRCFPPNRRTHHDRRCGRGAGLRAGRPAVARCTHPAAAARLLIPTGLVRKSFDSPEETRTFTNGRLELVYLDAGAVGRATFDPGWRWSVDVKPIAGTDSCQ